MLYFVHALVSSLLFNVLECNCCLNMTILWISFQNFAILVVHIISYVHAKLRHDKLSSNPTTLATMVYFFFTYDEHMIVKMNMI